MEEANAKHQETEAYDPIEWAAKTTDNTNDMRPKTWIEEDNVKEQNIDDTSKNYTSAGTIIKEKVLSIANDLAPDKLEYLTSEKKDNKMVDMFLVQQFSWIEASELGYDSYSLLETYWESLNPENYSSATQDSSSEDKEEIVYYCRECHAESRTWDAHKEHMLLHQTEQNRGGVMSKSKPKEKKFECDFCDKSYTTKGNLRSHVNQKHFEVNQLVNSISNRITEWQDSYKCSDCSIICKTIQEMQVHIVQRHLISEYVNQTVGGGPITISSSDDEDNKL